MESLQFFGFVVLLTSRICWSVTRIGISFLSQLFSGVRSFLVCLSFTIILLPSFVTFLNSPIAHAKALYLKTPSIAHYDELIKSLTQQSPSQADEIIAAAGSQLSTTQKQRIKNELKQTPLILQQTNYWEHVVKLQPSSRDALFDLSVLYGWQNDRVRSEIFLQKAKQVDPNYAFPLETTD